MLPSGHIEFTWAALNLIQRKTGRFGQADYRLVALAGLAPDLLDKPLALTVYRDTNAALFWGHNLWLHLVVWLGAWGWTRLGRRAGSLRPARRPGERPVGAGFARLLPYLLAFSGHLIADRMWGFQESLFYPLGAGYWHPWVHVGEPAAFLRAYLNIIVAAPILLAFEGVGLLLLAWLVWDRRLWHRRRLAALLATGRVWGSASPDAVLAAPRPWDGALSAEVRRQADRGALHAGDCG